MADLQRRLEAIGFGSVDPPGRYGESTRTAVADFQRSRGLSIDGLCGVSTWSALIESVFKLGDRLLCLRSPMLRGDDVADLQLRLGVLGFDPGRVDGIFGSMTQYAVGQFQRNAGVVSDSVCGPETVAALLRLEGRAGRSSVTGLREREHLRRRESTVSTLRIAIGSSEADNPIASGLAAELQIAGSAVLLLQDLDWSAQAVESNRFQSDLFIGITVVEGEQVADAHFFAAKGYESIGGRLLAEFIMEELPATPGWGVGRVAGMRIPILRETKAPAISLRLGDSADVAATGDLIIAAVHTALVRWVAHPFI